jgi:hypothetical protein
MSAGYVATLQTVYELSQDWYAGRLAIDWSRHDKERAEAILTTHGLTGPFWSLD